MIAPERTMGKPFFGVFWASKTAAGRLSEAPIKRTAQSEGGIFERLNHAFVRRIIMQPHFGQAHAKLACQTMDCCLRPGSDRVPDTSAPQPPGAWTNRAKSFNESLRPRRRRVTVSGKSPIIRVV